VEIHAAVAAEGADAILRNALCEGGIELAGALTP